MKTLFSTVALLAVLVTPAFANDNHYKNMSNFKQMDVNGNGSISDTEFKRAGGNDFSAADTNDDGVLSKAEVAAHISTISGTTDTPESKSQDNDR